MGSDTSISTRYVDAQSDARYQADSAQNCIHALYRMSLLPLSKIVTAQTFLWSGLPVS